MNRTLTSLLTAALLAISIASTGCGDSSRSKTGMVTVAATTPAANATGVSPTAAIQITFSGAVNPSTVNATNIKVVGPNNTVIAGTVTYNSSTNVATFTPASPLAPNATYTVTITNIASSTGTMMSTPFTITFSTGSTSGSGGGGTAQYAASLFGQNLNATAGEVSMDTSGTVTVQLKGATASTTFTVQFCPAYPADFTSYSCFNVGTVASDSSGNASTTMAFPQAGSWAGDFELLSGGTIAYETDVAAGVNSTYMSTLQPASTVNGKGILPTPMPQDPLTSGSVSFSNGSVTFQLTGASPNTTYSSTECPTVFNSSCYQLYNSQGVSGFTTDANGDVTFTVLQDGVAGDMFQVGGPTKAGFIGGFVVP